MSEHVIEALGKSKTVLRDGKFIENLYFIIKNVFNC